MEGQGYWLDEAWLKLKRKNQILFEKDEEFLRDLTALFREQEHRTMVLWALELAAESVAKMEETYPDSPQPRQALEAAWAWAEGKI